MHLRRVFFIFVSKPSMVVVASAWNVLNTVFSLRCHDTGNCHCVALQLKPQVKCATEDGIMKLSYRFLLIFCDLFIAEKIIAILRPQQPHLWYVQTLLSARDSERLLCILLFISSSKWSYTYDNLFLSSAVLFLGFGI